MKLVLRFVFATVLLAALTAFAACSSDNGGNGGPTPTPGTPGTQTPDQATPTPRPGGSGIQWQQRGGGESSQVPPSVERVRIVFQSETGDACCVGVDPNRLPAPIVVLDNLEPGPAIVTITAFGTEFVPADPNLTENTTCETIPADAAQACDMSLVAPPVFESDPVQVTIVAGAQTNIGSVQANGFPYALNIQPVQGSTVAPSPGQPYTQLPVSFTVADPVTDIERDSVAMDLTFNVPEPGPTPSFRLVTKRVPLQLTECNDSTGDTCSPNGELDLAGFNANGVAEALPNGAVDARIFAVSTGNEPRDLDFSYSFNVANNVGGVGAMVKSSDTSRTTVALAGGRPSLSLELRGSGSDSQSTTRHSSEQTGSTQPAQVDTNQSGTTVTSGRASIDLTSFRSAAAPSPTPTPTPAVPAAGGS